MILVDFIDNAVNRMSDHSLDIMYKIGCVLRFLFEWFAVGFAPSMILMFIMSSKVGLLVGYVGWFLLYLFFVVYNYSTGYYDKVEEKKDKTPDISVHFGYQVMCDECEEDWSNLPYIHMFFIFWFYCVVIVF